MLLPVIILILGMTVIQLVVLLKKKKKGEAVVVTILMIFSLVYGISGMTQWDFPAPGKAVEIVFKPLSNIVFDTEKRE